MIPPRTGRHGAMRKSVLVIAPQAALRAAMARFLMQAGDTVEVASNAKRVHELLEQRTFDAAIMSGLHGAEGYRLTRDVQASVNKLVILTDEAKEAKRLSSAFTNALVCQSRPLNHTLILSFVAAAPTSNEAQAALREITQERVSFENRTLDLAGRAFHDVHGREVPLTRTEFALLAAFVRNPGHVLSRNQLRNATGGGVEEAYERGIDMLVSRLRRKIEPGKKTRFIVTVPGSGYKFVARVHRIDQPPKPTEMSHPGRAERGARIAERRQLAVLACQIVGIAELSSRLDPEDLHKVLQTVHLACARIVQSVGGAAVRALGDNVLAYFGYPAARENDAESAVRAGLELARSIGKLEAWNREQFQVRIGIATGLMVIADMNPAAGQQPSVIGEALIQALHLQTVATAGTLVIDAGTRDLVGQLFDCQRLESVTMPNAQATIRAWRVIREAVPTGQFEGRRNANKSNLVGREEELERLNRCWSKAQQGSGQVVHLLGEAGIGKSRLVLELEHRLSIHPHRTLRYAGSPYQADVPLSALRAELQVSAGFAEDDTAPQKSVKLRTLFDEVGPAAIEAMMLLTELLDLPVENGSRTAQLAPRKRKERIFETLLARIQAMAARQPLLIVVEDAHWIDPTSLELLTDVVERATALPILVVVIGRPEFAPPWPDHSHVTALTLSRVGRAAAAALVDQIAGTVALPLRTKELILSRTDGVPLFVEELTAAVIESFAVCEGGGGGPIKSNVAQLIPTTLHASLLARLDRLDHGKRIAQVGAAIGREFSYELLRTVADSDEQTLVSALDRLVASGLVFRRGSHPQATFVFKHALVRDAAYGMLLRAQRQTLHASIAQSFEAHFPDTVETQPELLAYHHGEARNAARAVAYLLLAAERALLRSALPETLTHLTQARELVTTLPQENERSQLELKLDIILGRVFTARRSYTAPETREAYSRARARCEALGNQTWLPMIILGQWLGAWSAADHQTALKEARDLYSWGERNKDGAAMAVAHLAFGMSLTVLGDPLGARRHLEQGLKINEFALPSRPPFLFSDRDGRVSSLTYLHNCLLLLGLPDQAGVVAAQAEAAAQETEARIPSQSYSRALAQNHLLRMHVFGGDVQKAMAVGSALLQLSQDNGYPYFIGTSTIHVGWALVQGGEVVRGTELYLNGMEQLRSIGANCWFPRYFALLADCYERAGEIGPAQEAIAEALKGIEKSGERIWEAEIYRLKGRLLMRAEATARETEACFVKGMTIANRQQAKLLELRAATGLAELLMRNGKTKRARRLLGPIHDSFSEGSHHADLVKAKALVDRLQK
jgi:DNA-binding response OmpR family regulator/class 3 adenylate cyclase/tetratricopeptide (TPR) repeat protein